MPPKNTSTPIRAQSLVRATLFVELNPGDKQRKQDEKESALHWGWSVRQRWRKDESEKHVGSWGDKSIPK